MTSTVAAITPATPTLRLDPGHELASEHIPLCLRQRPQWVCWRYLQRGGKPTKCPISALTGQKASATDPSTWATFAQALEGHRAGPDLDGIGFVFSQDDPFAGVDLDDCIDDGGRIKPWAQSIIEQLGSYAEISPSGTGVKVFVQARKTDARCRKPYHDGEVEIYDHDRFFTVTGRMLDGVPADVRDCQAEFDQVQRLVFGAKANAAPRSATPSNNGHTHLGDDEIIARASGGKHGAEFSGLFKGHWQGRFPSQSEADASLVCRLAFYARDPAQLDRLFRSSGLMRPKWDEQHGARTYGQRTIAKGLAIVTKQYRPAETPKKAGAPSRRASVTRNADLPEILVADVQLSEVTGEALEALHKANRPPTVFVRAGTLTRVVRDENGMPRCEPFDRVRMRCRLGEVANFFALRKAGRGYTPVSTNPPLALAENVLALGGWDFPPLAGITTAPILRTDGSICTTPGYDPATRLLYCPEPGLNLPEIPSDPNVHEVEACMAQLTDLIADFPFADDASKANALAMFFSILMRPVISGHVPLAIIDAPVQGTGKTLLVSTLATVAVGRVSGESIPARQNEDEWRKKITSILLSARPFVLLDNIPENTTLNSSALAAALTASEWSDRLLGRNDHVLLPSRAVWAATGNNLRVAGDMPRRSYGIRLDANAERPWERTGFRIADLDQHVVTHRGELLAAGFTVIRGWYTAGQPRVATPPFGSFDEWAGTVGSVLGYAGIEGFLANLSQTRAVQDEDTRQWCLFMKAWWEAFGPAPVTVSILCQRILAHDGLEDGILPDQLLIKRDKGEGSLRCSLGKNLSRLTGRVFNGYKLHACGLEGHRKVCAWSLQPFSGANQQVQPPQPPQTPARTPASQGEL